MHNTTCPRHSTGWTRTPSERKHFGTGSTSSRNHSTGLRTGKRSANGFFRALLVRLTDTIPSVAWGYSEAVWQEGPLIPRLPRSFGPFLLLGTDLGYHVGIDEKCLPSRTPLLDHSIAPPLSAPCSWPHRWQFYATHQHTSSIHL